MLAKELKADSKIYWVGGIDWNLRNFHGYSTDKGSSYNAYLIVDEKITLIDTVKSNLTNEMLARISSIIGDPSKIEYVISNHVEMDHSGSLPAIMQLVSPTATLFTSASGEKGLHAHYFQYCSQANSKWNFKAVQAGDSLSLGKYTLQFLPVPMVHWPDSMVTYLPQQKLLFSNDAFGQHLASSTIFDDEVGWDLVKEQASKYYANIILPYDKSVQNTLNQIRSLGFVVDMIAPAHGVVLRSHVKDMLELYQKWSNNNQESGHQITSASPSALIIYDTMWNSTAKMADTIQYQLEAMKVAVKKISLTHTHISDVMTEVMFAKYLLFGSPTLNNQMLPTMAAMLNYLSGLRPKNKVGFIFGSYGWGGQASKAMEDVLRPLGWSFPLPPFTCKYIPTEAVLNKLSQEIEKLVAN